MAIGGEVVLRGGLLKIEARVRINSGRPIDEDRYRSNLSPFVRMLCCGLMFRAGASASDA